MTARAQGACPAPEMNGLANACASLTGITCSIFVNDMRLYLGSVITNGCHFAGSPVKSAWRRPAVPPDPVTDPRHVEVTPARILRQEPRATRPRSSGILSLYRPPAALRSAPPAAREFQLNSSNSRSAGSSPVTSSSRRAISSSRISSRRSALSVS